MTYTIFMPEDIIAKLILALQQHSTLSLFFVFLVAFSESLIVVGLIVPGAILMMLFGALIAMDALALWPTIFFAISGAVAGDSLSYWLGRRFRTRLHNFWPLSRKPEVILRANHFFDQHGVKSIFFSRFIGLLRPVIPAIAGMARVPAKKFIITNISSALLWAPLYLLPGLLFGLSFEMASEFASKFIFIIVSLFFIIILSLWAIQRLYLFIKPYNENIISCLLYWGKKHSVAGKIPAAIFDKSHPETYGLSLVALIFFLMTLAFSLLQNNFIIYYLPFSYNFSSIDQFIYHSLQKFRSPPLDSIMLWLNYLTSSQYISLLYFSLASLFVFKKEIFTLWHWLAIIALPLVLSLLLQNDLTTTLQQNLNINIQGAPFIVVVSAVGFLTIIVNSRLSFRKKQLIYYLSASIILCLMLAQLYFATQVFSQILFGLFIGLLWFNLLGIAYTRHTKQAVGKVTHTQIILIITALLIYPSWKTIHHEKIRAHSANYYVMGTDSWIESGWELLPIIREGIRQNKNNLFNLQWLGTEGNIRLQLLALGFTTKQNTIKTLSNWFIDNVEINQLPVLPHIHKGKYEKIHFYHYNKNNADLTVVRLWPSIYRLKQDQPPRPLWFGSISIMEVKERLDTTFLVTKKEKIKEINFINTNLTVHKKTVFNQKEDEKNVIFLLEGKL